MEDKVYINVPKSPMMTTEGQKELYLYHLKKMADLNANKGRIPLTNLFGIKTFFFKANDCMAMHLDKKYAVIRMDIYRFKAINELCGRAEGDRLLQFAADCFRAYESEFTVVGHLRADIFAMCVPFTHKKELIEIVDDINDKISEYPVSYKALPFFGICMADGIMDVSLMCDYADLAIQSIKGKVYSYYAFYDEQMRSSLLYEKIIENEVAESLQNRYILPYIQPKVDMRTGEIIGGEALMRWKHPVRGFLQPDQFIPILEKSGHIVETDIYIWNSIFKVIRHWMDTGVKVVPISVNVSREHVYQKNFVDVLCRMARQYEVPPAFVPLELTESVFTEDSDALYENIKLLQKHGFMFSIDDFGSGYSSLNMLKDEPVDEVKIDRMFLEDIQENKSRTVIKNVVQMICELGIEMVAEGVENQEQADLLVSYGCVKAQGFYYYRPMMVDEFEKLLVDIKH